MSAIQGLRTWRFIILEEGLNKSIGLAKIRRIILVGPWVVPVELLAAHRFRRYSWVLNVCPCPVAEIEPLSSLLSSPPRPRRCRVCIDDGLVPSVRQNKKPITTCSPITYFVEAPTLSTKIVSSID